MSWHAVHGLGGGWRLLRPANFRSSVLLSAGSIGGVFAVATAGVVSSNTFSTVASNSTLGSFLRDLPGTTPEQMVGDLAEAADSGLLCCRKAVGDRLLLWLEGGVAFPDCLTDIQDKGWSRVRRGLSLDDVDQFVWRHRHNAVYACGSCIAFVFLGGRCETDLGYHLPC